MLQASAEVIDISAAVVTAATQTYSGSAKTPVPTVTLNGSTIPSTGYDVSYSNNINAGTATITVTGKGDYTGTATGTFVINQATGQVTTVPTARNVTYSGSSQYLVTAGSGTGTMYYRYKLSTSSTWSSWSTARPSRTSAGTYNIEYYAAASSNGNYTQSATGSLDVTMKKASRTLSFSPTYAVVATSGTLTKTPTVSAGSSDGTITYSIGNTTYATINSSSGKVTAKTSDGSVTVTATISEGSNYLSASASYTLYVFATTHTYAYSGTIKSLALPPGTYKLQCWGAQGGSITGSYNIAGSKGGYSEGVITLSQQTTFYIFVGGAGTDVATTASKGRINGGWNCAGGAQKKGTYSSGDVSGNYNAAPGGGMTDICLTTSSMSYSDLRTNRSSASLLSRFIVAGGGGGASVSTVNKQGNTNVFQSTGISYGGGTFGGNAKEEYRAGQSPASSTIFGFGKSQKGDDSVATAAGGGGSGWYGGISNNTYYANLGSTILDQCGGGSGFVNVAASAENRPSGYTGLELDSGETKDGATSFPNISGTGNETGHSGNGYATITRTA